MSDVEEPVVEEEVDPYAEEIAALGPPPGMGASAAECDEYNYAVAEIEQRQVAEALEAEEAAVVERETQSKELTSQTRRPLNEDPRASFGSAKAGVGGGDGTGRAEGT